MRNAKTYLDLADILMVTKQIEALLEKRGGSGKGMWEKANSIAHKLPKGMVDDVLRIAEVRNNAMHHDPVIKEKKKALRDARLIIETLKAASYLSFILDSLLISGLFFILIFLGKSLIGTDGMFIGASLALLLALLFHYARSTIIALVISIGMVSIFVSMPSDSTLKDEELFRKTAATLNTVNEQNLSVTWEQVNAQPAVREVSATIQDFRKQDISTTWDQVRAQPLYKDIASVFEEFQDQNISTSWDRLQEKIASSDLLSSLDKR